MSFTSKLNRMSYNSKEKAYVYSGGVIGAVTPIIAARYLFFPFSSENTFQELISWGGSLFLNAIPMIVKPHFPAPLYTALAGIVLGDSLTEYSMKKRANRESKRRLEEIKGLID